MCCLQALGMTGRILGNSPLRVLASRTAIVPVNKELMPRSHVELERCSRTVYVANIDKKVDREDVRRFFEQLCGEHT
jgi:polyadenylate-binding protein